MDKDAILPFIKKNAFPLCCGAVAIAAIVLLFYPLGGWIEDAQAKAATEAGQYATIAGFTRSRYQPTVDPTKTAKTELAAFPNPAQVKVGQTAIEALTQQSQKAMTDMLRLNDQQVHAVLVPGLLPAPPSDTLKFQFADLYKKSLNPDPTISGLGDAGGVPPPVQADPKDPNRMKVDEGLVSVRGRNLYNDILRAAAPADPALIEARKEWLWQDRYFPQVVTVNGVPVNKEAVDLKFAEAARRVPDELDEEIANTRKVYVDHDAFSYYPAFLPTSAANPNLSDIWYAQLQLWMQTDIAQAIADINDGRAPGSAPADPAAGPATAPAAGGGIRRSPVKRILKLELVPQTLYRGTAATGGTGTAPPPSGDETQPITLTYTAAPTGRTSNGMYDVVPFGLLIDVDAAKVNDVLAGLTRDRLIYIDSQSACSFDPGTLAPMGYLYGSRPVVRLTLHGEELFLRSWTKPLMPLLVQQYLGIAAGGTPGGGGGGPSSTMPPMPNAQEGR